MPQPARRRALQICVSLRPPQWDGESVCQSNRPGVPVMLAQPAAIAGLGFQAIEDVVIQTKIGLPNRARGELVLVSRCWLVLAWEGLLHAGHKLRTSHDLVPQRDLTQPVSPLDPVPASKIRSCVFRP